MRRITALAALMVAASFLAACDTSVTPSYQVSPQNTIALHDIAASGKKAQMYSLTAAAGVDVTPSCRLMGPIDVGGGQTAEVAIRDALTAELLAAGMYSPKGVPLSVKLTKMDVSTVSGYWILGGVVSSPKLPGGYGVEIKYDYTTSFSAIAACHNAALAFNRATAEFINEIVTSPHFRKAL